MGFGARCALVTTSARGLRKLAVLTNIVAPYRLPMYERLAKEFDVRVFYSGAEGNRRQWAPASHVDSRLSLSRSWGCSLSWTRHERGVAVEKFLHVNPGLLADLYRWRPDAVISSEMGFRTITALSYGKLWKKPVWVWWGGTLHTERMISSSKRKVRQWLAKEVQHWFSYGSTSTEYLLTLGVRQQLVTDLQNCVPEAPYLTAVPPALHLQPRPVLLYVGQLIPRKGVDLLVEAAAKLQAEGLEFSLVLVGDGSERPAIQSKVDAFKLQNVHFLGFQSPDRLPALYRSADVLIFPTLVDIWGLVVNEALWSGLTVLVSQYAGCARELVSPGSTFDPLDPADFACKLKLAVLGRIPPPDRTRLKSISEVSDLIAHEVNATLDAP